MAKRGRELLQETLEDSTANSIALGRVLKAIYVGTLSVNGQLPDAQYPLGEYLIHGGRIKFDLSALTSDQQNTFFQHITNGQAKARTFATHRAGGTDASGSPAEAKSGVFGAISDFIRGIGVALGIADSKHYGINLAIGGKNHRYITKDNKEENPNEDGEWGHMYLHKDANIVLVGIEGSAPGKTNKRTGDAHSKTGGSSELSPFLEYKINDQRCPMSVIEKYNWATIKISKVQLGELFKPQQGEKYSDLANKIPRKAEPAEKNRTIKELAWAKATKKANKPSIFAKILGGLLVVAGIIIAAIPIPVVTQALGGGVAALGIGIVTGVVGLGLVSSDIRGSKSAAKKQYRKELAKLELADTPDKPNDQEDKLSASTEEQTTPQPDAATTENCGSGNSYQPLFEKTQAAPSKGTLDPNKEGSGIKPSNHCKKTLKEIRADSTSPERPDTEPKSGSKSPGM